MFMGTTRSDAMTDVAATGAAAFNEIRICCLGRQPHSLF